MRVVVDATACADLDQIAAWIAKQNPDAARRVLERILATIAQLGAFPHISRPGRANSTRERVVAGTPYIIVFQHCDAAPAIIITAIVHARRVVR